MRRHTSSSTWTHQLRAAMRGRPGRDIRAALAVDEVCVIMRELIIRIQCHLKQLWPAADMPGRHRRTLSMAAESQQQVGRTAAPEYRCGIVLRPKIMTKGALSVAICHLACCPSSMAKALESPAASAFSLPLHHIEAARCCQAQGESFC